VNYTMMHGSTNIKFAYLVLLSHSRKAIESFSTLKTMFVPKETELEQPGIKIHEHNFHGRYRTFVFNP